MYRFAMLKYPTVAQKSIIYLVVPSIYKTELIQTSDQYNVLAFLSRDKVNIPRFMLVQVKLTHEMNVSQHDLLRFS